MGKSVGIGHQDFEVIRKENYFYVDKTMFIREWWERGDSVTLINRPRRFGKTLTMSMVEKFFSVRYADRGDLFEGLRIWEEEKYRHLQGTYPVISLTFANVKEKDYPAARRKICQILTDLYAKHQFLMDAGVLNEKERKFFAEVSADMDDTTATFALHQLTGYLARYCGKRVILLLDEYDTPMQEAYVNGYWEELISFFRSMLNAAFKTNPDMERGIMTGITRVSRESIFSDLNNLKVVTTTSKEYADCFGFTEEEVFAALDAYGLSGKKREVKDWYDGFTFGDRTGIYNPWSVINCLDTGELRPYWANSSSNSLAGKLLRESDPYVKRDFETLLRGETIRVELEEQVVYEQLHTKKNAIWSLLLASGYLKVVRAECREETGRSFYELALTNREVCLMFEQMIQDWFSEHADRYNDFIRALLAGDLDAMNDYMNRVALSAFSYFDTGSSFSRTEPERFYHGFVLGLLVDLRNRYVLTSNRESGFGRYDVMLEPLQPEDDAIIMEFKVFQPRQEKTLQDTVSAALRQIADRNYAAVLTAKGIAPGRIRCYGFAFQGKQVLIGTDV